MNHKFKDITGQRFGRLIAESYIAGRRNPPPRTHGKWACVCDCGNEALVEAGSLVNNLTRSCGCLKKEMYAYPPTILDLSTRRFGRLIATEMIRGKSRRRKNGRPTKWKCVCDCGNHTVVRSDVLMRGDTKSCGCLRVASGMLSRNNTLNVGDLPYSLIDLVSCHYGNVQELKTG